MTPTKLVRAKVLPRCLSLILIFVFCTPAFSWGDKGHRIIGALAWSNLSEPARKQVADLVPDAMSDPNGPLAAIGPWADGQRLGYPAERNWHFVAIKVSDSAYQQERDCGDGNCIVVKLNEKKNLLQFSRDKGARAEALKYVVHFVGDIHQPLHCSDNNDDAGNSLLVRFMGERTNLHRVWDYDMLERSPLGVAEYAKKLSGIDVTKGFWIEDWANESHETARRYVYALPKDNELGTDYYRRNLPILERQLALAAEKLIQILEEVLKPRPNAPRRRRG